MKEESQKKICSKSKKMGVNLLTIHGAKGLEYSVVILLKLSDKMMY
jgi:ATP-dependent exoDNAse (exonuclease V) beta subunit